MFDRRVPFDLAFLDEQAERGGGEQLRIGRDAEERLRVHRRRLAELPDAVALRDATWPSLTIATETPGTSKAFNTRATYDVEIGGRIGTRSVWTLPG